MTAQLGWRGRPVRSTIEWAGMRSHYAWLPPHRDCTTTGAYQVGVSFSAHTGLVREAAGRAVRRDIRAGTAFITGADPISWIDVTEPTEALEIYPDRVLMDAVAAGPLCVDPTAGLLDGVLFGLASVLKRAHVTGEPLSDIEASSCAHRLVEHLAGNYRGGNGGTLSRPVLDRIVQYIEANLAGPITLDGLAAVATLSPYHFARAFKATTGLAPHRFVTVLRLEAAKTALVSSRTSVAEVAYSVGFSNVSHFRRIFRRELGLLPGEIRSDNRKNGPSAAGPMCANVAE